jgi:hypothetical protein
MIIIWMGAKGGVKLVWFLKKNSKNPIGGVNRTNIDEDMVKEQKEL